VEHRAQGSGPQSSSESADSSLVERLGRNEPEAYESLVRSHGGAMLAAARRILRDEDEARDAVQDAFLAAFRGLADFEGTARLSTWLHRIVVNAALMRLRRRRRKPEEPIEALLPRFLEDGHHARPPAAWAAPDDLLARGEDRAYVRACIDRLPEDYRTVLVLRDIEELDTAEAARALGMTVPAVKTRLHRAREALRTLLADRFESAHPGGTA